MQLPHLREARYLISILLICFQTDVHLAFLFEDGLFSKWKKDFLPYKAYLWKIDDIINY